jgi:ABC-type glutathione transport system ATPase component
MIGAEPPQLQHRPGQAGGTVMAVKGLTLPKHDQFGVDLKDIAFDVRAGEIVGIAGVSGNGQQELMAALSGEDPRAPAGSITLFGQDISQPLAAKAAQRGPALRARGAPGPRRGAHAVAGAEHAAHAHLHGGRQRAGSRTNEVRKLAEHLINRFNVKAGGRCRGQEPVGRQPAEVHRRPRDRCRPEAADRFQPTWGVDVGAAALIRGELLKLRDAGCALLVVSEELDELFEICDRLVVIAQGACFAQRADRKGHHRDDRRVDVRPVEPRPRGGGPCSSLKPARNPSKLMSIASPLLALAITVVIGTACSCARQGPDERPAGLLHRAGEEPVRAVGAGDEGHAAAAHRARPRGVLPLQRVEHRRRGAVHRRRHLRQAGVAMQAGPELALDRRAGAARRVLGGMVWAASWRCCATASTPARSWSA